MKKAFSVAEAMITLLIVSLILAVMAPIMSKKTQQTAPFSGIMPPGAVIAFDLTSCPIGWKPLTTTHGDAGGAFIRNIGGGSSSRGLVQYDAAPNITGWFGIYGSTADNALFQTYAHQYNVEAIHAGAHTTGAMNFNASRIHHSYGRDNTWEVRPKNIAFLYCRKN